MNNDLISREAAIAQIERRKSLLVGDKTVHVDAFIKFLKNRPAVDAEPIRHGRWIQSKTVPSYHCCSRCRVLQKMKKSCNIYVFIHYCPYCGAKMDGKDGKNGV